jgi:hypothetical protein
MDVISHFATETFATTLWRTLLITGGGLVQDDR